MKKLLSHALRVLSVTLFGLALASCTDTDGPPEDLVGVAAAGAATQGTVYVVDSMGAELSKTINLDGSFKFDVRGMTAPFMLKTVASNGIDPDLFSYALEENISVNVTPLTNLAMYIASSSTSAADLGILYDSWASAFTTIDALVLKDAQATVNANLATQYTAFSLDPFTYDFFASRFLTNGTSVDALLEAMSIDPVAGTIDIVARTVAGVATPITLDFNIPITDFDIGGTATTVSGAYTLSMALTINTASSGSQFLSINLPAASVPTSGGSTQMVEDMFTVFYGSVGAIVINSVIITGDAAETIAVVDADITKADSSVLNYTATYTYTLNP
ncbi:MAG: hypothetical protein OEM07_00430 [Gammaproteobacteria bacterium]|nr:hypothetical protein [Gammaproteobacteria bacterium]